MIYPAPTTRIDPTLARGVLEERATADRAQPGQIVLSFANTNYRMRLTPTVPIAREVGNRIVGVIRVDARRVDAVDTGGKYVEPVFGRPRRVQGRVVAHNDGARTLVVDAGMAIHLRLLDARQRPSQFAKGELVSCDVLDDAVFIPATGTFAGPGGGHTVMNDALLG